MHNTTQDTHNKNYVHLYASELYMCMCVCNRIMQQEIENETGKKKKKKNRIKSPNGQGDKCGRVERHHGPVEIKKET